MSRAERRRQAREQAKADKHPSPLVPLGEGSIISVGMGPGFAPSDYGMPRRVTRQWVVENSTEGSLGTVQIPADRQDGFMSHAEYQPDCPHEDCRCEDDESVMWELTEFSGGGI